MRLRNRLSPFGIMAIALFLGVAVMRVDADDDQPEDTQPTQALCTTDSECARLCPKEDKECDGGPQS